MPMWGGHGRSRRQGHGEATAGLGGGSFRLLSEAPRLLLRHQLQLVLGIQRDILIHEVERHRVPLVDLW